MEKHSMNENRTFSVFLVTFKTGPQTAWTSDIGPIDIDTAIELIKLYYFEEGRVPVSITAYGRGFHLIYSIEEDLL